MIWSNPHLLFNVQSMWLVVASGKLHTLKFSLVTCYTQLRAFNDTTCVCSCVCPGPGSLTHLGLTRLIRWASNILFPWDIKKLCLCVTRDLTSNKTLGTIWMTFYTQIFVWKSQRSSLMGKIAHNVWKWRPFKIIRRHVPIDLIY